MYCVSPIPSVSMCFVLICADYMTPSPGISPLTPGGADYSPRTPGSPMEVSSDEALLSDIEVVIKDNYHVSIASLPGIEKREK